MKLLPVFVQVAGELGVGTVLFVWVQQTGEIRKSFFSFMSWLTAACFFLVALAQDGSRFYVSVYFPAAVFAGAAAIQFSLEGMKLGRILLLFSGALALVFLFRDCWSSTGQTGIPYLSIWNLIGGILLFGWSNGAMILGHWYLVMRGLSFGHFQRATFQLLLALAARLVGFGIACYGIFQGMGDPMAPHVDMLFLTMRILWGFVLPGAFGFMAWRCALIGSNQAGTGLLYIAEVAVLIGEILAGFMGF